jgi:peptidoglycan/LPS O-acetylase OafA/YrhL
MAPPETAESRSERLEPDRDNNFNLIRMLAAGAVLVSHAYPIARGTGAIEPLASSLGISLGTVGVLVFFAISGYFISQSYDRRRPAEFWAARLLRIYPGLLAALLLTVLMLGPAFTELPIGTYLTDTKTWLYTPYNLSLLRLQYDLPSVFAANPYPGTINGSLWTLVYEVGCYGMVAALAGLGITATHGRFVAFLLTYLVLIAAVKVLGLTAMLGRVAGAELLTLPFVIGMTFYHFRHRIRFTLGGCALVGCLALLAQGGVCAREAVTTFCCYLVFYLGYLPFRPLRAYNRVGDYSFGTYIYAFPCEQVGAALLRGVSPFGLIVVSLPVTLALAVSSWHFVESRMLARRRIAAGLIERILRRLAIPAPQVVHARALSEAAEAGRRNDIGTGV